MLGNTGKIEWKRTAAGLEISFPDEKPCDIAYAFKIQ
jgi:alpha-L-fucosidase